MKSLVIFDLDGTLLNTIADFGTACNYALKKMGYPSHPISAYNFMVGNGVRKLMQRAEPDADAPTIDRLLVYFREYYDEHCTDNTLPYPGIPELLEDLTSKGVKVAVATNKYQSAATHIINHYFPEIPFVAVMGQIDDRPVKPDPSVVFAVLSASPAPKADVVFVGDSAVDIDTARRACVDSIGVTWGFRPISELRRAYADNIVNNPQDIMRIVSSPYSFQ